MTNFQRHKAEGNSDHDWGYLATWAKEMEPDFNSMARDMFHYAHADDHGKLKAHPGVVRQVDEEVKAMCSALKDSGFHSNAAKALSSALWNPARSNPKTGGKTPCGSSFRTI